MSLIHLFILIKNVFSSSTNTTIERRSQKSPSIVSMSQQESKSLGSMSSKSPFSLSRQGTLRSSHSRKNSTGHTLTLNTGGRRSPSQQLISPSASGRRSPVFLMYDGNRTPLGILHSIFSEKFGYNCTTF